MRRINYAGGTIITGDEIAEALLSYAAALANANRAATIHVPVAIESEGSIAVHPAEVLVGPASQLVAEPVEWSGSELEDRAFLERVEERTKALLRTWNGQQDNSVLDWDI